MSQRLFESYAHYCYVRETERPKYILFALVREAAGDTKKAYASVLTSSDQTISHVRSFLPFRKFKTRFVRLKNELFDYLRAVAAVILIFVLCTLTNWMMQNLHTIPVNRIFMKNGRFDW
jgi:hypothetical protein